MDLHDYMNIQSLFSALKMAEAKSSGSRTFQRSLSSYLKFSKPSRKKRKQKIVSLVEYLNVWVLTKIKICLIRKII